MSLPNGTGAGNQYDEFLSDVQKALEKLKRSNDEFTPICGSPAMSAAIASGLKPRMTYTVAETSSYTGISRDKLYRDHERGAISFIDTGGERGSRILVTEVDRYLEAMAG